MNRSKHRGGQLAGSYPSRKSISAVIGCVCAVNTAAIALTFLSGCERRALPAQGSAPNVVVERSEPVRSVGATTSFAPVVERVAPSVVSVYSTRNARGRAWNPLTDAPMLRRFFGQDGEGGGPARSRQEQSLGSGVVVSRDGYILTNNHVVDGADEIRVATADSREFAAKLVGVDPATDIAVLKVVDGELPPATLADSTLIRVGDLAFAIGNPFGVGQTVTMGIISATERTGFGITEYEDFIQTDAAVNPGNSGGPLIDAEGRVIGINTAILSRSGGNQGIGFSVPINLARFTMEQLIKNGRVIRGYLGIYIEPPTPGSGTAAGPSRQTRRRYSWILTQFAGQERGAQTGRCRGGDQWQQDCRQPGIKARDRTARPGINHPIADPSPGKGDTDRS